VPITFWLFDEARRCCLRSGMNTTDQPLVLLTGFEPFGPHRVNSSWEAVRRAGARLGSDVITARLPVDRIRAARLLTGLLQRHRPDACLLTGLARGERLRLEVLARRPRALAGPAAPALLTGSWPLVEAAQALRLSGMPLTVSRNAGRYVCDSTYWALLNFREAHGWPRDAGFLHVPPLSKMFTAASLASAIERVVRRRLALRPSAIVETGR
jgi:pyroglutamyl-peptidase